QHGHSGDCHRGGRRGPLPHRRCAGSRSSRQAARRRGDRDSVRQHASGIRPGADAALPRRLAGRRRSRLMNKVADNRAWFLVIPVVVLVAFNALIPLMTVVNYSVQETFGDNFFFWSGVTWFEQVLRDPRFHGALMRQLMFT